ncbi:MAG: hypothetical protein H6515_14770 [Microthrixaceae bacterium]|jgi:predicted small metal-binding protein|nr:hypothetical protein [Microthrixaceae bacterium]
MITTDPQPAIDTSVSADEAREIVQDALEHYVRTANVDDIAEQVARAFAHNVKGWTHTTRLRDFLEAVTR